MGIFTRLFGQRGDRPIDELADKADVAGLLQALASDAVNRRAQAAAALGQLYTDDSNVTQALLAVLRHDPAEEVRVRAAEAVGLKGDDVALDGLLAAIESGSPAVVEAGVTALFSIESDSSKAALAKVLHSRGREVLSVVANHLYSVQFDGSAGSEALKTAAAQMLIAVMKDESAETRSLAAYALGALDVDEAVEPLLNALNDESDAVRESAFEALGEKKENRRVIEVLLRTSESDDEQTRARAIEALGRLQLAETTPRLMEALSDSSSDVRWRAASALGDLNAEEAIPALESAMSDPSADVRYSVATALGKLGRPQAVSALNDAPREERHDAVHHDPVCARCGTVYNRAVVIRLLQQVTPETFLFEHWSTSFKCKKCGASVPISG